MNRFHDSVIRPLLDEHDPRTIVEIGAFDGLHTFRLAEWVALANRRRTTVLHVVDPAPGPALSLFDGGWMVQVHRQRSLDVDLATMDGMPVDCALIDGDHNYYTVLHELLALRACPLIFLHDVEWPYARRDAYHDPAAIPDEFRQPLGFDGVVEGWPDLRPGGVNQGAAHALREGGPRNGVLTALEDFLAEHPRTVRFHRGNHGLAVIER